jgi:uncharacterized protein
MNFVYNIRCMNYDLNEKMTFNFECLCCGECCGSGLEIFLNSLDIWNLRSRFRTPTGDLIEKFLIVERRAEFGSYPLCLIRHTDGRCPFQDGKLCAIHPVRPASCRLFPVTHQYGARGEAVFEMARGFDFCKGGENAPPVALDEWLAGNSIGDYEKAVEIQKRLTPLARLRLGDREMTRVYEILFNFDSAAGFLFAGNYPEGREPAAEAIDWIHKQIGGIISDLTGK